jgi:hypothetical protein
MVRRGSWCGVAHGAAWLMVRRGSWCGVAQLIARWLAVRFSARHHREFFPTELTSDDEMERGLGEWRRVNVLNECDCMNVCYKIWKINQKSRILPPNFLVFWPPTGMKQVFPKTLSTVRYVIVLCSRTVCNRWRLGRFWMKNHPRPESDEPKYLLVPFNFYNNSTISLKRWGWQ